MTNSKSNKTIDFNTPDTSKIEDIETKANDELNQSETFLSPEEVDNNTPVISGTDDGNEIISIETPIGTEVKMTKDQYDELTAQSKEPTKFQKELKEILVSVSQERLDAITAGLKKGILKLEYIKDGSVKPDNKEYVPITYGQNRKVNRIMKLARLMREDIDEVLKEKPNLTVEELVKKYPEVIDEDTTIDELRNVNLINEFVGNYVIAQKAKIYWGIDNIENYVLSDLVLIIGLYEQRNNFTNS